MKDETGAIGVEAGPVLELLRARAERMILEARLLRDKIDDLWRGVHGTHQIPAILNAGGWKNVASLLDELSGEAETLESDIVEVEIRLRDVPVEADLLQDALDTLWVDMLECYATYFGVMDEHTGEHEVVPFTRREVRDIVAVAQEAKGDPSEEYIMVVVPTALLAQAEHVLEALRGEEHHVAKVEREFPKTQVDTIIFDTLRANLAESQARVRILRYGLAGSASAADLVIATTRLAEACAEGWGFVTRMHRLRDMQAPARPAASLQHELEGEF